MSRTIPGHDELKQAFDVIKGEQIPSIPDIVVRLHGELNKEEPDTAKIVDLVSMDQAVTGHVLKTVNSPLFGLKQPVESIGQAVVLLGIQKLKNVVTAAAFQERMQVRSPVAKQIWRDSLHTAQIAMKIAQQIQDVSQDEAYLAAMLHNCGAMLLAEKFPDYKRMLLVEAEIPANIIDRENRQLGSNHAVIGYMFAKHWKLPDIICQAIYHHHDLRCDAINDSSIRALIAIIKMAYLQVRDESVIGNSKSFERIQYGTYAKQELMLDDSFLDQLRTDTILEQT